MLFTRKAEPSPQPTLNGALSEPECRHELWSVEQNSDIHSHISSDVTAFASRLMSGDRIVCVKCQHVWLVQDWIDTKEGTQAAAEVLALAEAADGA